MINIPDTTEAAISASLSTQIIIKVQAHDNEYYAVGAVKKFHVIQSRAFRKEEVEQEDGTFSLELIPGPTETIIELERTVFDGLTMTEAFGRGFRSITSQSEPFNIQVETIEYINKYNQSTITTYHNCWFSHMSSPIKADNYIILEKATVLCEHISTQRL